MDYTLTEWLNLLLRWAHVFAAILWVGSTYFFTWLDGQFARGAGDVWLVHSGGFYIVKKEKLVAGAAGRLHWFRYEAAATWATGLLLLFLVYDYGGLMADAASPVSARTASMFGYGAIVAGWVVYDGIWLSPLRTRERLAVALCFVLLVATAWGLSRVMSGRAAYIFTGAVLGTIMTANVWSRILPGQRAMIASVEAGRAPDLSLAARAKLRSKHNTFLVVPVVAIMISNHFPVATYGNAFNWLILGVVTLAGWTAAAWLRRV
jgi:uncharacterized membrane protein